MNELAWQSLFVRSANIFAGNYAIINTCSRGLGTEGSRREQVTRRAGRTAMAISTLITTTLLWWLSVTHIWEHCCRAPNSSPRMHECENILILWVSLPLEVVLHLKPPLLLSLPCINLADTIVTLGALFVLIIWVAVYCCPPLYSKGVHVWLLMRFCTLAIMRYFYHYKGTL